MAVERRLDGEGDDDALRLLRELPEDGLKDLRTLLARIELQSSIDGMSFADVESGTGGNAIGLKLPGGATWRSSAAGSGGCRSCRTGCRRSASFIRLPCRARRAAVGSPFRGPVDGRRPQHAPRRTAAVEVPRSS